MFVPSSSDLLYLSWGQNERKGNHGTHHGTHDNPRKYAGQARAKRASLCCALQHQVPRLILDIHDVLGPSLKSSSMGTLSVLSTTTEAMVANRSRFQSRKERVTGKGAGSHEYGSISILSLRKALEVKRLKEERPTLASVWGISILGELASWLWGLPRGYEQRELLLSLLSCQPEDKRRKEETGVPVPRRAPPPWPPE